MTSSVAAEHPLASQGCMVSAKRVLAVDEFCPEGTNLVICWWKSTASPFEN